MASAIKKNFNSPDESRPMEGGKVDVVTLGEVTGMRLTANPGWKWSTNVKPIAQTDSCQVNHIGYQISEGAICGEDLPSESTIVEPNWLEFESDQVLDWHCPSHLGPIVASSDVRAHGRKDVTPVECGGQF